MMPNEQTITYQIADFQSLGQGESPLESQLFLEIGASAITRSVQQIVGSVAAFQITFGDDLLIEPGHDERAILDAIVQQHRPDPSSVSAPTAPDGAPVVEVRPPSGSRFLAVSHDFCDPCTWYTRSLSATETLSDSGDGLTFQLASPRTVIDLKHGRVTAEDDVLADDPSYAAIVTVDSGVGPVSMAESSADSVEGGSPDGDFQIDYETGSVTFNSSQAGNQVQMTYRYSQPDVAESSCFVIKPPDGYDVTLKKVELEFCKDVVLKGDTVFATYGKVDFFAPHLMTSNGGPLPPGTLIPIATNRYKTMRDFERESQGVLVERDTIGGAGWRGSPGPKVTMVWPYRDDATSVLKSSLGMEIRAYIENNTPHSGSGGVITIYGTKKADSVSL